MKKLFLWAALLLPATLFAQDFTQHYKIYNVKQKKLITLDDLIADLKNTDVLFFGEEHNDSIGHYLEATLFNKFSTAFQNKVGLTLEMFHTDVQLVINEYLAGVINEKSFIKEARAWNNYKDYKPMIEYAKTNNIAVIGANAATRYSNAVTRGGLTVLNKLPAGSYKNLAPLPIDTATGPYLDKFLETLGGHGMGGMKIYQTQNLWDATMAWSIAQYAKINKGHKIFQINGRFHSDEKLGTLAKLKMYSPKLRVLNISCFAADDFNSPDWSKYERLGDYIMITNPTIKKTF